MGEPQATKNWFARRAEAEAQKDRLPYSERIGNVAAVVVTLLVVLYFVAHQMWSTGFFTAQFGSAEIFLFYTALLYSLIPAGIRSLIGRKNLARAFEVVGSVLTAIALAWLYIVFPLDFSHFADVLPTFLRFLLQWISNDIARVLMIIGIIAASIMAAYTAVVYMLVRQELSKPATKPT